MNSKQRRALARLNPKPGTPVRVKIPHWSGKSIHEGIIHPTRKPWGPNVFCVQIGDSPSGWHMVPRHKVEVL